MLTPRITSADQEVKAVRSRSISFFFVALLLTAVTAAGCTSTDGEKCDGGAALATVDEAVRGLIDAAQTNDPDAACKVVTNTASDEEMTSALADLRGELNRLGVDAASANIVEGDQGGSLIPVRIRGLETSGEPIDLGVLSIRDEGYRVIFP